LSFLLDTCVLSEGTKEARDPGVRSWVETTPQETLFICTVTLGEIRSGIERLSMGSRRAHIEAWFAEFISQTAPERILPFDLETALLWGALRARDPNSKFADSQIAATALVHGLTLVTRNVRDFRFPGLPVFNPWSK
jgi:hypothetical protein